MPDVLRKVLVIEDDDDMRAIMVQALSGRGYEVVAAPDAIVGLQLYLEGLLRHPFTLVLLDISLPLVNGLACARAIREIESGMFSTRRTQIGFLTAIADLIGETTLADEVGPAFFLRKPEDVCRLPAAVDKAMGCCVRGSGD